MDCCLFVNFYKKKHMKVSGSECEVQASPVVLIYCPHISVLHSFNELRAFLYPFIYTTAAEAVGSLEQAQIHWHTC